MTYAESLSELEAILRTMQSDSCDIDRLAAYTRRATELVESLPFTPHRNRGGTAGHTLHSRKPVKPITQIFLMKLLP